MRKSSVIVIVILLLVVMLGVGAVGYLSKGFKNWDYKDWFKQEQKEQQGVKDNEGNVLEPDKVYAMPSRLGVSTVADVDASKSTVNLIATVKPDNATMQNVEWSVEWVGEGFYDDHKTTDYLTLNAMANNPNAVTVTIIKAFGQQLKIIAKSKDNPNLKCETIVDYVSDSFEFVRYNNGEFGYVYPGLDVEQHVTHKPITTAKGGIVDNLQFSAGIDEMVVCTVRDDYTYSYTFKFDKGFKDYIEQHNLNVICGGDVNLPLKSLTDGLYGEGAIIDFSFESFKSFMQHTSGGNIEYAHYNQFMDIMRNFQTENPTDKVFYITTDIVGTYNSYSFDCYFKINPDALYIYNTDITVNNDHIYVGGVEGGVKYE